LQGSSSYIRTGVGGRKVYNNIRGCITLNTRLLPDQIEIPVCAYESIHLTPTTPIILNRDPSISGTCIFLVYATPCDGSTIRINTLVLDGLHADVDGDTVNMYVILDECVHDEMKAAIGYPRAGIVDVFGNLRYKFTQHHALYMYTRYHNRYPGGDPLVARVWNGLKSSFDTSENRDMTTLELLNKTAVALYLYYGPQIYDRFVRDIIEWTSTTTNTIIAGASPDVLIQIVRSGAKGSLEHLVEMERLKECDDLDDYISRSYTYLANFIHSSQELPQQGHLFYRYNAILNGLYCDEHGNLCMDGKVMIRKFCDNIPTQLSVDTDILKLCLFGHITNDDTS
jgi:hypothetical protein